MPSTKVPIHMYTGQPNQSPTPATPVAQKTPDAGIERQSVVRDDYLAPQNNGAMFVCELKDFLESYGPGPNVPDDNEVNLCLQEMSVSGSVNRQGDGKYCWSQYQDNTPAGGPAEPLAFKPLDEIINGVLRHIIHTDQRKTDMQFKSVPNKILSSDIHRSNHKIDGCFLAQPLTRAYESTDIPNRKINIPFEFKKARVHEDRRVVHLQILGACHHVMNEDIRRMWIYGFTFEDGLCSVWYFSRSHHVKAKAFNWIDDPETFIRVLLMFAKADAQELGIDRTVHLGPETEDKKASYVYEVPVAGRSRFFKTVQAMAAARPLAIANRTTRVWKVKEVASASGEDIIDDNAVILKDVWVNDNCQTEVENLEAVFDGVEKFIETGVDALLQENSDETRDSLLSSPTAMREIIERDSRFKSFDEHSKERLASNLVDKTYKSLFLTPLHTWTGTICKPLAHHSVWPDSTLFDVDSTVDLANSVPSTRHPTVHDSIQEVVGESERQKKVEKDAQEAARTFVPRRQVRCVFKEVCTTLQNLDTLEEAVDVLAQTMDTMHILFLAGWVHRDISVNNIMAYRSDSAKPWTTKLADLEFARLMVDPTRKGSAEPRTGTAFFIPVEILQKTYLLREYRVSRVKPGITLTLADQINSSTTPPEYLENLARYKPFSFTIAIPPEHNPCWEEVPPPNAAVIHNYQHDLESIWWILLWIITCHICYEDSYKRMQPYFQHHLGNASDRTRLFFNGIEDVALSFRVDVKSAFSEPLQELLSEMEMAYLTREVFGHLNVSETYAEIQVKFAQVLWKLQKEEGSWRNIKLNNIKAKGEHKQEEKTTVPGPSRKPSQSSHELNETKAKGKHKQKTTVPRTSHKRNQPSHDSDEYIPEDTRSSKVSKRSHR